MRLRLLLPVFALLLALAACDDAPGVGLDLVNDGGGLPEGVSRPAARVTAFGGVRDFTSSVPSSNAVPTRVLAGRVADPVLATVQVDGAFDFGAPGGGNLQGFRASTLTAASLVFRTRPDYGDTTSAVTYRLRTLARKLCAPTAAAVCAPVRSDSTLATTGEVTTFTVGARDTLVTVPLPAAWLAANATRIQSANADTAFKGFVLEAVSGGVVRAIPLSSVRLRAQAGADTALFVGAAGATLVRRVGTPAVGPGRAVLQDGFPVALDVMPDTAGIGFGGLARVSLVVPYDTTLLPTPGAFARPRLGRVSLYGISRRGTSVTLANAPLATAVPSRGRIVLSSPVMRDQFQRQLLGRADTSRFVGYRVQVSDVTGGLGAIVVDTVGPRRPYFVFTLVRN